MFLFLGFVFFGITLAAPQYGAPPPPSYEAAAPQPQFRPPQYGERVQCRQVYNTVWDTEYVETETKECTTVYDNACQTLVREECNPFEREACQTVQERQCNVEYREQCSTKEKIVQDRYTETECSPGYEEVCEHEWRLDASGAKVWVPLPSTCRNVPKPDCRDVDKIKDRLVRYPECVQVPDNVCVDVPKQVCTQVADQKCSNVPYQACEQVPRTQCQLKHKKVPHRVSKQVPRTVCNMEPLQRSVDDAHEEDNPSRDAAVEERAVEAQEEEEGSGLNEERIIFQEE